MKNSFLRMLGTIFLITASLGFLLFVISSMSPKSAGTRDFISYWAAGQQLVHGANPYDAAAVLQLERPEGWDNSRPNIMLNLPTAFFLALPLGLVSAKTGLMLWFLLLLACLVASIRMLWILHGRPAGQLHLLCYLFAPVLACLMAGQLGIVFLRFHQSRPFLAGAALLLCAIKPHLFLPFGIVLLAWAVSRKAYRLLAGFSIGLLASCALSSCVDIHAWSQYMQMMRNTTEVQQDFVPSLSMVLRLLVDRNAVWPQLLPVAVSCIWALWYFWTQRARWNWMDQGLLVLLVSEVCSPHAWFTDEVMVLPAVLAALYRADKLGRSLLPFGLITAVALIEVLAGVQITSPFFLWTAPAWLVWYLYATGEKDMPEARIDSDSIGEQVPQ
jgi:hypothetical protein